MPTTMTAKAQVTIPKAVRDAVGIQPGDRVEVVVGADRRILIQKAETNTARAQFEAALGRIHARQQGRKPRYTTRQIMDMTRGET
jgi:antitoxin PrlF